MNSEETTQTLLKRHNHIDFPKFLKIKKRNEGLEVLSTLLFRNLIEFNCPRPRGYTSLPALRLILI